MYFCKSPSGAGLYTKPKTLILLSAVMLSQATFSRADNLSGATTFITIAKGRTYNTSVFCGEKPDKFEEFAKEQKTALDAAKQELTDQGIQVNWVRLGWPNNGAYSPACNVMQTELLAFEIPENKLDQARSSGFKPWSEWPSPIFTSPNNSSGLIAENLVTVAKSFEIKENCDGVISPPGPSLETTKMELTNHNIPVTWARSADPQGGVVLPGCAVAPQWSTRHWLQAFEIPADKLDQALALGFKPWSEWPKATLFPSIRGEDVYSFQADHLVVKSSGPLQCDEQGKPFGYFRSIALLSHSESMGYDLNRAGIVVDSAFCAIRPEQPPQNICGQDSGKLDVLKIPKSSIPRALALGYQFAGRSVDGGGIMELKEIPCMSAPNPHPCLASTQLPEATNFPVAVATTSTAKAYDIGFTGTFKSVAKLKVALGKAVAQGKLVTYIALDAGTNQVNACVEPAANLSPDQFAEFVKSVNKQVKSKTQQTANVLVSERSETCGSALTASEAAGLAQKNQTSSTNGGGYFNSAGH